MVDFIYTILAFLVAITILVAVHEFGHFWVAKKMGVKVLRYSIGFGKPLWKKQYGPDQTEYVVASLPFGGYVKMLDEREGEVAESELNRAFNRQPVNKRFAIVAAGPVFNFIFAIVAYWLMLVLGVPGLKPVLGTMDSDSVLVRSGFQYEDRIESINGHHTPVWDIAIQELAIASLNREKANVTVSRGDGHTEQLSIDFSGLGQYEEPDEALKAIGLTPWRPNIEAVVGKVLKDSPAEKAGLKLNDKIISIGGRKVKDWYGLVEIVSASPGKELAIVISRQQKDVALKITPAVVERDGKKLGQIGISPAVKDNLYPEDMKLTYQYPVLEGLTKAVEKLWRNSVLTLSMIGKLITGDVSIKNLSGPINIAVYAGYSASAGFTRFLDFLAIISISLGVINLLPIPLLDGGHLMYYVAEIIRGKPVSETVEMIGQRIGIAIIFMMMALAIGNDLARVFGG